MMRQPLRKIEAVDGTPGEAAAHGVGTGDRAAAEIGMIFAAGRVVFMPEKAGNTRVPGSVTRNGR